MTQGPGDIPQGAPSASCDPSERVFMEILNKDLEFSEFDEKLRSASKRALLLDYDGTLAPFRVEPRKAFPYPGVRQVLNRLMRTQGIRIVIVTGRWIKDLLPLLQLEIQPEIWGSHGLERLGKGWDL